MLYLLVSAAIAISISGAGGACLLLVTRTRRLAAPDYAAFAFCMFMLASGTWALCVLPEC